MKPPITIVRVNIPERTTPAMIDHETGILYENIPYFDKLDPHAQTFVRLHEEGHYVLDTRDEDLADSYAFYRYSQMNLPLSESIKGLTRGLSFNSPEHYRRLQRHLQRVYHYDFTVNGNQQANPKKLFNYSGIMKKKASNYGPAHRLSMLDGPPTFEEWETQTGGNLNNPNAGTNSTNQLISGIGALTAQGSSADPTSATFQAGASAAGLNTQEMQNEALKKVMSEPANILLGPFLPMGLAWDSIFGKKKDAWDKLTQEEKEKYVNASLEYAFSNADSQTTPKDLFSALIAKMETQDKYGAWIGKNPWVPPLIAAKEKASGKAFTKAVLNKTGSSKLTSQLQQIITGQATEAQPASGIQAKLGATSKRQGNWYYIGIALALISVIILIYTYIIKRK